MDVSKAHDTCSLEGRVVDENEEVCVLVNGQQSRWFEVEEGLRQKLPIVVTFV